MEELQALREAELNCIESLAEGILDGIATIRAGRQAMQGYLLRINQDNDIEIVRGIKFNVQETKKLG